MFVVHCKLTLKLDNHVEFLQKIPLLCMLVEARRYILDQNGLELTCEINSFSWLVKSRLFATTGHVHSYLIYDHLFYVHWLSFYRSYNIIRLYRPSFTWTNGPSAKD